MEALTMAKVHDDIKFLIELAGYYEVLSNNTICVSGYEADPISVNGKTVKILSENMRTPEPGEEIAIMNPFKQVQVNTLVLTKYYRILSYVPARMIFAIMERTIKLHEDNSECNVDEIAWLSKFEDAKKKYIDDKTLNELHKILLQNNKVKANQILSIKYDRDKEKSVVKSDFMNNIDSYNIRKKTITLLKMIFETLLGDDLGEFSHTPSTLINRQGEAMLTTIHNIYERMGEIPKVMLGVSVDLKRLRAIIADLEKYSKFTNHIVDISTAAAEDVNISSTVDMSPNDIRASLKLDGILTKDNVHKGQALSLPQPLQPSQPQLYNYGSPQPRFNTAPPITQQSMYGIGNAVAQQPVSPFINRGGPQVF